MPVGLSTIRLRSGAIRLNAAAELVVRQRREIERRVVAPQAEPEASLAVQVAVAGPHVAAGLGQERDDVGAEARRPRPRRIARPGAGLGGLIPETPASRPGRRPAVDDAAGLTVATHSGSTRNGNAA